MAQKKKMFFRIVSLKSAIGTVFVENSVSLFSKKGFFTFLGLLQIVVMELLKGTDTVKFTATPNYGPTIDEPKKGFGSKKKQ